MKIQKHIEIYMPLGFNAEKNKVKYMKASLHIDNVYLTETDR